MIYKFCLKINSIQKLCEISNTLWKMMAPKNEIFLIELK